MQVGDLIRVPDERIGESVVDEIFNSSMAARFKKTHPLAARCDEFIARDPGDNLIVRSQGIYLYWDHESGELIRLGSHLDEFIIAADGV